MQTNSRDGRFILSAPDNAKTGSRLSLDESQFDEVIEVNMEAIKDDVSLYDVANAVRRDCFGGDGVGLQLLAKSLRCHLTVGKNKYDFTVNRHYSFGDYLESIAEQFKL